MEEASSSTPSTRNREEEFAMEEVWSELEALKGLYRLLHKPPAQPTSASSATAASAEQQTLDGNSRSLLMRMLDDATRQALLRQAKVLSGPFTPPVLEKKLSFKSNRQMRDIGEESTASPKPYVLEKKLSFKSNRRMHDIGEESAASPKPHVLEKKLSFQSNRRMHDIGGESTASSKPSLHCNAEEDICSRHKLQNSMRSRDGEALPAGLSHDAHLPIRHGLDRSGSSRSLRNGIVHSPRISPQDHAQHKDLLRHDGSSLLQRLERSRRLSREPAHKRTRLDRTVSRRQHMNHRHIGGEDDSTQSSRTQHREHGHIGGEDSVQSAARHFRRQNSGLSTKTRDLPNQTADCNQVKKQPDSSHSLVGGATTHVVTRSDKSPSNLTVASRGSQIVASRGSQVKSIKELSRQCSRPAEGSSGSRKVATMGKTPDAEPDPIQQHLLLNRKRNKKLAPSPLKLSRRRRPVRSRIKSRSSYCSASSSSSTRSAGSPSRTTSGTPASSSSSSWSDRRPTPRPNASPGNPSKAASTSTSVAQPRPQPLQLRDRTHSGNHRRETDNHRQETPPYNSREITPRTSSRRKKTAEKRKGQLRRLKNSLALVFHHHHDHDHHHHHHHIGEDGEEDNPRRELAVQHEHHHLLPWRYLGRIFHRTGESEQKRIAAGEAGAQVSVGAAEHHHGRHLRALFSALVRHLWGERKKAGGLRRMRSRVQVKKLHWWQRLRGRRTGLKLKVGRTRAPRLLSATARARPRH